MKSGKMILQEATLYLGRFYLLPGPPAHESQTSTVVFALDKAAKDKEVALKVVRSRVQFKHQLLMESELSADWTRQRHDIASVPLQARSNPVTVNDHNDDNSDGEEEGIFEGAPFLRYESSIDSLHDPESRFGSRRGTVHQSQATSGSVTPMRSFSTTPMSERELDDSVRRLPYKYIDSLLGKYYVLVMDRCENTLYGKITNHGFHERWVALVHDREQ